MQGQIYMNRALNLILEGREFARIFSKRKGGQVETKYGVRGPSGALCLPKDVGPGSHLIDPCVVHA